MVQDFSLRHPLISGHGNFGSPDHPPAAERYTECRLATLANEMLAGIDEETVDFVDNYSGEFREPVVLPSRFPNLLVNGSQGIAVGMATNIPPHNLGEVIDATVHLIDHPDATPDDLMQFVKGPDFPTGALILGRAGILDAYRTGRGSIRMRARAEIEENKKGTFIVVTELPYQASPAAILTKIADLVTARELDGVADINDESSGNNTRLVVKLKRDANANVVLNNLYKHTPLQTSFGVNMVALDDGVPRTLNLAQALTGVREPSGRGHHPPVGVPPEGEAPPRPHRRRPDQGARHDRRDHRAHPGVRRQGIGARRADGAPVRVQRGAGGAHPRHAAEPADTVGPERPRERDGQAARRDRRARGHPQRRRQAAERHQDRARRGAAKVRHTAPRRDHLRPGRDRPRGPDRRRRARHHDDQGGLREVHLGGRLPHPGPGRVAACRVRG